MSELDPAALGRVTQQIFEEAAFLFAEAADGAPAWDAPVLEASLSFAGPLKGQVHLCATQAFGAEAAANLLGVDPGDEEASSQAGAALAELLNMICGSLMKEWFGTKVVCQLGIPVVNAVKGEPAALQGPFAACLVVDERHRIDVRASFE